MDIAPALVGALIGLPFGALASAGAWYAVFHGFRPKLIWIHPAEGLVNARGTTDWAVAFRNDGRRNAVEVQTHARLRVRGLIPGRPNRWIVIEIPTNNTFIAKVEPFRRSGIRVSVVLLLREIREGDLERLPSDLATGVSSGMVSLPGLLQLGDRSELTLAAVCADGFSGARHASTSAILTSADLSPDVIETDDSPDSRPLS